MNSENSTNNVSGLPLIEQFKLIEPLELQRFQYEISLIFEEAIRKKWSLQQFAIKILANCAGVKLFICWLHQHLYRKRQILVGKKIMLFYSSSLLLYIKRTPKELDTEFKYCKMDWLLTKFKENTIRNMTQNEAVEIVRRQVKLLFKEAEKEKLSAEQFAVKIWLGVILGSIPEITLVSILFEKATNNSPAETYEMIKDLTARKNEVDAVKYAISLIVQGLKILDTENDSN
ncbi:hypothetical protein [Microcoleus sp. B4-C1]|uniref:hypothetical protein n=1 Tax=Microcoleus sp. B4-C1 TaxID=2818660 RepID=UPI002FD253DB